MNCDTRSVLVVDDVIPNVKLLSAILRSRNYNVLEATNGPDAIALAKERKPAIIVLDVMMPGMDGFEVCKILKADPSTSECAVIYVSAKNSAEDKIRGLELGAVDYITKPFQKAEVLARVETHVALQVAKIKLKEEEAKYLTIVEAVQDGIFLWTRERGVFFSNRAFGELVGRVSSLADFVPPSRVEDFERSLGGIIDTPSRNFDFELEIIKKDGSKGCALCRCAAVEISGERVVFASMRDISESRRLCHERKMDALGILSAGIAHDFNNLMSLVRGYAELALLELGEESPVAPKLEHILTASKNAISLTRGLLALSREKNSEPELFALDAALSSICEVLSGGLPKNIALSCDTSAATGIRLYADQDLFQRMLVNLCLNARDAMPEGGALSISVQKAKGRSLQTDSSTPASDFVVVSVADSGVGIKESIRQRVFEPFFSSGKDGKAAGLGLSIADRIARNHGGWIDFESEEGRGSVFRIHLPLTPAPDAQPAKTAASSSRAKNYKHSLRTELGEIIIADPDEAELAIAKYFLDKAGYKTSHSASVEAAYETLRGAPDKYGLLILDRFSLSEDFPLEKFKKLSPKLRFLMLSDSGAVPLADAPLLRKPFSVKELLQTLDRI